jgi:hypothetical protein
MDTAYVSQRNEKHHINENLNEIKYDQLDRRQSNFTFEDIGSFSIEWPFVAFADR